MRGPSVDAIGAVTAAQLVRLDVSVRLDLHPALLAAKGWTPFEVGYTRFAFKADHLKVNVSAYTSGKVVVAGKGRLTGGFAGTVIEAAHASVAGEVKR